MYPDIARLVLYEIVKTHEQADYFKKSLNWRGPWELNRFWGLSLADINVLVQDHQKTESKKLKDKIHEEKAKSKSILGGITDDGTGGITDDGIVQDVAGEIGEDSKVQEFVSTIAGKPAESITTRFITKWMNPSAFYGLSEESQQELMQSVVNLQIGLDIAQARITDKQTLPDFIQVYFILFIQTNNIYFVIIYIDN